MGDRQRLSRKRPLYSGLPEMHTKFPRLDHGLSAMQSGVKDVICSCPPFECLCRGIPAFQPPDVYGQPGSLNHQPVTTSLASTSLPGLDHRGFDSIDFSQQQQWRDSYNEYFDMGHETKFQPLVSLVDQFSHGTSFHKPEYSMPLSTPTSSTPSMFDYYEGSKMAHSLFKNRSVGLNSGSDCMYSSDSVVGMSSPEHHTNSLLASPVKGMLPSTSEDLGTLPSSAATVSPVCSSPPGTTVVSYATSDMAGRALDDFEINGAADILSLDQPINKDAGTAPPKYSCQRRSSSSDRHVPPPLRTPTGAMDLSTLLGLPSITSFFTEENEEADRTPNEHVDRILGLSLNYGDAEPKASDVNLSPVSSCDQKVPSDSGSLSPCRGPTPPSLIELQPLHSSKGGLHPPKKYDMFSNLKPTDIIYSSQHEKAAFQPYVDHSTHKDNAYSGSGHFLSSSKYHHETPHDTFNYYHGESMQYPTTSPVSMPRLSPYSRHNHNINITLSY